MPAGDLGRLATLVDNALAGVLPRPGTAPIDEFGAERLVDSMRYSLQTPGKRLRPLLLLASAEAAGGRAETFVRFAVAVEMIHAYSLIHDDLPVMDDDDLRRGRATNHVVYGDGMAILAGDALLTEAFVVMCEPVVEPALQMRVASMVAAAAGFHGMVGGQAADLMAEGRKPDEGLLRSIHRRKTGRLIEASVESGALLAGADDETHAALAAFAVPFGIAFQIADDVKDETLPAEVTGKRGGGDRDAGKATYPALFGVERSRALCLQELDRALSALGALAGRGDTLAALARESVRPAFDAGGD